MNSFQPSLTTNPEQLYKYCPVTNTKTQLFERALKFRCHWFSNCSTEVLMWGVFAMLPQKGLPKPSLCIIGIKSMYNTCIVVIVQVHIDLIEPARSKPS